jgi:hypothetical protein
MERRLTSDGLTLEQFDAANLQYFAPAYGWLYHPQQPDATPQLRELVFLTRAEEEALMAALGDVIRQVKEQGKVDGDAAVNKFAAVLAEKSGHSQAAAVVQAAWQAMPEGERTFGALLRDTLGLRVRNAILYCRGKTVAGPATERAVALLEEHRERVAGDRQRPSDRSGLLTPVWRDAWQVVP